MVIILKFEQLVNTKLVQFHGYLAIIHHSLEKKITNMVKLKFTQVAGICLMKSNLCVALNFPRTKWDLIQLYLTRCSLKTQ